jgi:hypothetical protein
MRTIKTRRAVLLALVLIYYLCGASKSVAQLESLPEMVKRHEQEIQALKDIVGRFSQQPTPTPQKKDVSCTKNFDWVGRYNLSRSTLNDGFKLKTSEIYLKLVRIRGGSPAKIVFASNIDVLHNKELSDETEYKFEFKGCRYLLSILAIYPYATDTGTSVGFFLNYE